MNRYIDANEALRMIRNSKQDCPLVDDKKSIWDVAHNCSISCVEAIPTADVVEVRHGKWGFDGLGYTCSECGEYALATKARMQVRSNYCPNCGAKMDGERG